MSGITTQSKLKNGSLTLAGIEFGCQPTNVTITPPDPPSGSSSDDSTEVLCGNVLDSDSGGSSSWRLTFTGIQDFEDPDGLINFSWENQGQDVPFNWAPMGTLGPSFSGTVEAWPLALGGDVNKRLTSDAEWTITTGMPTRTEATPPPAWAADTAYAVDDRVTLTGGEVLKATVAGTSGSTEPVAPAVGATVVDGSVTWVRLS